MKAVLISIQPKWVEMIASGKKTIEVRKSRPKLETPFKCYIYATKAVSTNTLYYMANIDLGRTSYNGKVIGEFVCDNINKYECSSDGFGELATTCGTCLTYDEILNYCNGNDLFGWHITDLKIYDKPKVLSEFRKQCKFAYSSYEEGICYEDCIQGKLEDCRCFCLPLTRPPQSWCYIEENKDEL